eukprot:TRINITY_DN13366_c0_g1_i1.p1 TRINITY_DN13366_c0_g1~~TRINITY_DN13366_c0_g1_i1.p1  ORF type:complete len:269 (+),score=23.97 TRINITY_DN13366_c0_g1_i1:58-807(+)
MDQTSEEVQSIGIRHGFYLAVENLCGFCSMAGAMHLISSELQDPSAPFIQLEKILEWVRRRRIAYVIRRKEEFSSNEPEKMIEELYISTMASTMEISAWVSSLPVGIGISLLCNILEGPPVDEDSIRFPRGSFVSEEEGEYLQREQFFHSNESPEDFFVVIAGGLSVSLQDWANSTIKGSASGFQVIILDLHGHYNFLKIFRSDNSQQKILKLTIVDSQPNSLEESIFESRYLKAIMTALQKGSQFVDD